MINPSTTYERNQDQVGKVFEVMVEGPSKRDESVATTRTRGNRLVHVAGVWDPGTTFLVEVTRAAPHYLEGSLVS